jgi:iron-sulfur cluster repair protein YtfE (RIC family)
MPVKRHKGLAPLSRDHHQGLILAQLIKKDAPEYKNLPKTVFDKVKYTIRFYNSGLIKHFKKEEKILFPAVNDKSSEIDVLFDEIISEHKKIKELVTQLEFGKNKMDILDELGMLLESHIRKEERVLFEKIQNLLNDEELIQLEEKLS